ncbi:unnamed protein product [Amoebophrya sp. A120]|nr:unnamed protein product [Amoebophrya sp. A120]|eukprot:GSA120T00003699001.1
MSAAAGSSAGAASKKPMKKKKDKTATKVVSASIAGSDKRSTPEGAKAPPASSSAETATTKSLKSKVKKAKTGAMKVVTGTSSSSSSSSASTGSAAAPASIHAETLQVQDTNLDQHDPRSHEPQSLFDDGSSDEEDRSQNLFVKAKSSKNNPSAAAQHDDLNRLSVNRQFAEKFQKRKDAEELAYARKIIDEEGGSSSSSETEDEDGMLLQNDVDFKVLDTLQRIRNKDKSVYDGKTQFFSSADFFAERRQKKEQEKKETAGNGGEKKPVLYKDLLRQTLLEGGAEAFEDDERLVAAKRNQNNEEDLADIRAQIRAEVGKTDNDDAGEQNDDSEDDGEGLFSVKKPSADKNATEAPLTDAFTHQQGSSTSSEGVNLHKKKSAQSLLANKYWGEDEKLTENEKFLRDYILNEGWKDPTGAGFGGVDDAKEVEDEEALDEQDDFEAEYNFRYEHGGLGENGEIATFARNVPNSVRQVDDKRKRKRLERKERKEQEAVRKSEELKRLKNLKRKELQRRLRQIEKTTGNTGALVAEPEKEDPLLADSVFHFQEEEDDTATAAGTASGAAERKYAKMLERDFDPETYDKEMEEFLGEDYYEGDEELDEKELKALTREGETEENWGDYDEEWGEGGGDFYDDAAEYNNDNFEDGGDQNEEMEQKAPNDEDAPDLWFICDECKIAILPGKNYYESPQKQDFTLCQKCFKAPAKKRKEKYTRKKVPAHCQPPENWEELVNQQGDEEGNAGDNEERQQALQVEQLEDDPDDIYKIRDFGPLKFQYSTVKADSFNLTTEEILSKSDKELNKKASLRKLTRPYFDTSTYRDERTDRYLEMKKEMKQQKRKKQHKSGVERARLDAYKVKNPVLVKKNKS